MKAEYLKELAELRKKLEDADANNNEKEAEIENLKRLIKVVLLFRRDELFFVIFCNFSLKEANQTIEARNDELDAKTEELKKLIETNAEPPKVISVMMSLAMMIMMMIFVRIFIIHDG